MIGALLGLAGMMGGGAAAAGGIGAAGTALAGGQLLSGLLKRRGQAPGASRVVDVLAPSASSGVIDAINQHGKSLMGAGKDFLIGDDPLKTFLGTAKPGSSQGVIPSALGNVGIGYRTSGGAKIGPFRPIGPNGLLGGFNRSLQKQHRPIRILRPTKMDEVYQGYSRALGGDFGYV